MRLATRQSLTAPWDDDDDDDDDDSPVSDSAMGVDEGEDGGWELID